MYNKGDINFKIADYVLCNPLKNYQQHELYSLIVNRWYYGLFLMAKSKLSPNKKINHRDHINSYGHTVYGIWTRLGYYLHNSNTAQKGLVLFKYREKLDYWRNDPIAEQKMFEQAHILAKELRKIL